MSTRPAAQAGSLPPGLATLGTSNALQRATLQVVALSVVLAVALELLLLLLAAFSGTLKVQGFGPFVVDGLGKLPWAVVVCGGLSLGLVLGRGQALITGLAGLLAAPVASLGSRAVLEVAHALALAGSPAGSPSPFLIAALRGAEYVCLGTAVTWIQRRTRATAAHHAAVGLICGLVFGGLIGTLTLGAQQTTLTANALLAWAINEVLFPIGCSLILFSLQDIAEITEETSASEG